MGFYMENTGGMVGREEKRDGPLSREEKRGMGCESRGERCDNSKR